MVGMMMKQYVRVGALKRDDDQRAELPGAASAALPLEGCSLLNSVRSGGKEENGSESSQPATGWFLQFRILSPRFEHGDTP
ncbi:unnamed protein product [Victoria cruziana]